MAAIPQRFCEVLCDICSEPKLKALLFGLLSYCLLLYCQSFLEPDSISSRHDKPLELFCRDDQQFICYQCSYEDHKNHDIVPLKEECEVKRAEMNEMITMIKERREKVEEIQRSVKLSQKNADREMEEGIKVFNDLMKSIEQSLEQFKQSIEEKQKTTEEEAADWIEKIETEIWSLEQRRLEMEQLWSSSDDHLHFLQTFTSVKPAPRVKDWSEVRVKVSSYKGAVDEALSELQNKLEIKKVPLKLKQQFAVDVTLDPDTANSYLVVSEDLKQVHFADHRKNLPDNPERFSIWLYVLGKQKFSSGRFYFEVQVTGKTLWIVGVANESVNRNSTRPASSQDGCWYILVYNRQFQTSVNRDVGLPLKSRPEKVGVFVDYEEGLVSFYDVDSAEIIYSFTSCGFSENLLPLFSPCDNYNDKNSAPLKLTPVAK